MWTTVGHFKIIKGSTKRGCCGGLTFKDIIVENKVRKLYM